MRLLLSFGRFCSFGAPETQARANDRGPSPVSGSNRPIRVSTLVEGCDPNCQGMCFYACSTALLVWLLPLRLHPLAHSYRPPYRTTTREA